MSVTLFLEMLFCYSIITSLIVEVIKKITADKKNLALNIVALIVGLIVGVAGTLIYYQLSGTIIDLNGIIYAVLLGIAAAVSAELGFDKVKQAIEQLSKKDN